MVYIRRAVMIMEPPSPVTIAKRDALEREKLGGGETSLGKRKRTDEGDGTVRKKNKVSKEPNPLSVKKKKRVGAAQPVHEDGNKSNKESGAEENVVGEVTESTRRQKSTRKRKHHKRSSKLETIPAESTEE
jgi:U3 small nucleolar RNA-associated protein 23